MAFAYYKKLNVQDKAIYRRSDEVTFLRLPHREAFAPFVEALAKALASESSQDTQHYAQKLANALTQVFRVPELHIKVLARRPSDSHGELHGLYVKEPQKKAVVTLWMRTAKRKQVVAFKTFLRTLLHEVNHHLDYSLLGLRDSFHTEGFYKRESSLFKQLWPQTTVASKGLDDA